MILTNITASSFNVIEDDSKLTIDEITINELNLEELTINSCIDYQKIFSEMSNLHTYKDLSNLSKDLFKQENLEKPVKKDYNICPLCEIPCKISDTFIICTKCGMERVYDCHAHDLYSLSIESNYNTINNSYMTFNIVGTNSYNYNRSLLKTCADYSSYRANSNKKEIINKIYQFDGNKPPMNVINETAALFDQIKQADRVYRGDGKLGVIGACLYYISIKHNLTRTPKEIAKIMGIEERFLSQGDRILQELAELSIIEIPINHKPLNDYLNMYMPILGIDSKYKQFVIDIIARAERKHLHIGHDCRLTTKVVGVLYLLTLRVPSLKYIKKDVISAECNFISISTYKKYATLICDNYKVMKKVFKRHSIPMPASFRE